MEYRNIAIRRNDEKFTSSRAYIYVIMHSIVIVQVAKTIWK